MIQIKVCGMRDPLNIKDIAGEMPDYLGFIFFPGSKRYVGDHPDPEIFSSLSGNIKKTGVFVDENKEKIFEISSMANLNAIQLHGNETPGFCNELKESGLEVIKTFHIGPGFNFDTLKPYEKVCDFFLFDTKSELAGGSGKKFDWELLESYNIDKPFFLSGGIGPWDVGRIKSLKITNLFAVDINSGFEASPGIKDPRKVKEFIKEFKEYTYEL
jgi:phosphoribosylanthranilate isomerase